MGIYSDGDALARMSDLWEFDFSLEWWRHIDGSTTAADTLNEGATIGSFDVTARIGPRYRHAGIAVLARGSFYFFGGNNPLNDGVNELWEYRMSDNQWRYVKDSVDVNKVLGIYNTILDTTDAAKYPGGRQYHSFVVKDDTAVVFGGFGATTIVTTGVLNDIVCVCVAFFLWLFLYIIVVIGCICFYNRYLELDERK